MYLLLNIIKSNNLFFIDTFYLGFSLLFILAHSRSQKKKSLDIGHKYPHKKIIKLTAIRFEKNQCFLSVL